MAQWPKSAMMTLGSLQLNSTACCSDESHSHAWRQGERRPRRRERGGLYGCYQMETRLVSLSLEPGVSSLSVGCCCPSCLCCYSCCYSSTIRFLLLPRLLLLPTRCVVLLRRAPHSPLRSICCRLFSVGAGRLHLQALLIPPDPALGARPIDHRRRRECGQARQPLASLWSRAARTPKASEHRKTRMSMHAARCIRWLAPAGAGQCASNLRRKDRWGAHQRGRAFAALGPTCRPAAHPEALLMRAARRPGSAGRPPAPPPSSPSAPPTHVSERRRPAPPLPG